MLRRVLLGYVLSLLLLLSQQGAVTHDISHLRDYSHPAQDQSTHASFCDQCLTYSSLDHATPGLTYSMAGLAGSFLFISSPALVNQSNTFYAYSSRAPPVS
ncbi:hypothetical protein LG201_09960 [Methylobacillus gramineus]|uniref:hypothetical protein n=1 Tax=Methylobacillus gramineus TaxID=755169 RepID=UPI001CFFF1F3|nr:hypothetical protein [Methylobacillus gramineus]MCB5185525.1 hypothetical protein [Methylobacillus gramineus]